MEWKKYIYFVGTEMYLPVVRTRNCVPSVGIFSQTCKMYHQIYIKLFGYLVQMKKNYRHFSWLLDLFRYLTCSRFVRIFLSVQRAANCLESSVIRLDASARPFAHAISSLFVPLPSFTISDKCAIKYAIFLAVEIISLSLWSH